ncbi:MAG TPA: glutamine synthetase, partial [Sphingopyxis terrae]|nr:glutamine synthetase [Sphingopyxis terrae]
MSVNLEQWISDHNIDEVECIVPDINGVQRGKVLPAKKFLASVKDKSLRIPGSVFICTIDGHYPEDIDDIWDKDPDKILLADPDTICVAPGFTSPTAFVIADAYNGDGTEVDIAPRTILKKVLGLYQDKGWKPIIAPEVEFYLVSQNTDPDFPLTPPTGQSGRAETASQPYGLEAMNEYEDIIDHIYDDCELMGLDIDTMIHEMGAAQLEVNFMHGDPLRLADEVFLFKRVVRNVAKQHSVYATFM